MAKNVAVFGIYEFCCLLAICSTVFSSQKSYNNLHDEVPVEYSADARHLTDEQRLLAKLRKDYDRHTRPVMNASHAIKVKLGITLNQVFDVDERNQVLTTHIWLDQEWFDEKMSWDPSEYNGLETLRVPCHLIWKPDIVLYNSADDYTEGYMPALAMISSNGHVFWPPIVKLRSTCQIDITYFPFDDQTCILKLGSWAYDGLQVDVLKRDKSIDLSNYVSNGEWQLLNVRVVRNVVYYSCCPEPYPDVTFHLHMRRRTLYYTYNVIIPCIMLSCLTLLEFWMPPEGGEKVALGLTVLLAYSVFMLLIAENMPASSFYVPLIGVYIIVVMGLSSLSVMFAVLVSNMHHQSFMERDMPAWLRVVAARLNKCVKVSPRKRGALQKPPATEATPDLKTPLRDSYSSINVIFKSDSDAFDLTYVNEHAKTEKEKKKKEKEKNGGKSYSSNNSNHIGHTTFMETATTLSPCGEATTLLSNHIKDSHSYDRLSRENSRSNDKLSREPSRSKRKGTYEISQNEDILRQISTLLKRQEDLLKASTAKADTVNKEWQEVAEIIDRFLFWVNFLIMFTATIVILVLVPLGKTVTLQQT